MSASKKISQPLKDAAKEVKEEVEEEVAEEKSESEDKQVILETINQNARLSISFVFLLLGSTVITALGLLLNDSAIVIGGMIISPLMWPLLKTAISISYGYKRSIQSTLVIVTVSIVITFVTSALLAYISPLKATTNEIMARTSPSFFHILIGLAGGGVATLALTKKRISTSLAGVAIATALHPPLVTSAIGVAFAEWAIFSRALILFVTNAISIIFIAAVSFSLIGFRSRTGKKLRNKSLALTAVALMILAVPLISFLRQQSFETIAYQQVRQQLQTELEIINPNIILESVSTSFNEENRDILEVQAQLWLPENFTLSHTEQQQLANSIENAINRQVNLQLQLQRQISLISEQDVAYERVKNHLESLFVNKVATDYPSLSIDSLRISQDNQTWTAQAVLRGNPNNAPTIEELNSIQTYLTEQIGPPVELSMEIIPLVKLETNTERTEAQIRQTSQRTLVEQGLALDQINNIIVNYSSSPVTATIAAQINLASQSESAIATEAAANALQTNFEFPVFLELIYSTPESN